MLLHFLFRSCLHHSSLQVLVTHAESVLADTSARRQYPHHRLALLLRHDIIDHIDIQVEPDRLANGLADVERNSFTRATFVLDEQAGQRLHDNLNCVRFQLLEVELNVLRDA